MDGYEPPVSEEEYDIVGAPGTRYFTFTGVGEGQCVFKMAYARPWEFDWEDEEAVEASKDFGYVEFNIYVE